VIGNGTRVCSHPSNSAGLGALRPLSDFKAHGVVSAWEIYHSGVRSAGHGCALPMTIPLSRPPGPVGVSPKFERLRLIQTRARSTSGRSPNVGAGNFRTVGDIPIAVTFDDGCKLVAHWCPPFQRGLHSYTTLCAGLLLTCFQADHSKNVRGRPTTATKLLFQRQDARSPRTSFMSWQARGSRGIRFILR